MEPSNFTIRAKYLRVTRLCIATAALCGVLIVGYALISSNHEVDFLQNQSTCRRSISVEINQANTLALQAILHGLANLDKPEEIDKLKHQVPDLVTRMDNAVHAQEEALEKCEHK